MASAKQPVEDEDPPKEPSELEGGRMPFLSHLRELRDRVRNAALCFVAAFIVCFIFNEDIFKWLEQPMKDSWDVAKMGEPACEEAFLSGFAARAYRRPLSSTEAQRLRDVYMAQRQIGGSFAAGLETMLQVILLSPQFLYREELGPSTAAPVAGAPVALTEYEIASQLSVLFTGSSPDATLWTAASEGRTTTFEVTVPSSMDEIERQAIEATLDYTRGDKTHAARALGIGRKTLYRKLDQYNGKGSSDGRSEE